MWRQKNFTNPYGAEWFTSSCQHQYSLGEAYEEGYNEAISAILEELMSRRVVTNDLVNEFMEGFPIKEE